MPPTPPGPERLTDRLRALRRLHRRPLEFVEEMAQTYGDIIHIRTRRGSLVFVNHPELIREILVTRASSFRKEDAIRDALRRFDGDSILVSEGPQWRQQRLLLQQGVRAESLRVYAQKTAKQTQLMLQQWPDHGSLDVTEEMSSLTMKTLADVVFGTQLPAPIIDSIRIVLDARAAEAGNAVSFGHGATFRFHRQRDEALRQIDAFLKELIEQRRKKAGGHGSLLSMLVQESDQDTRTTQRDRADRQIRDETMSMINASQDTTSAALVWTLYLVAKHPAIQTRILDECQQGLGSRDTAPMDSHDFPFTKMVAQESLRLYPPNWVLMIRRCIQEATVGGYRIPEGSWMYIFPYVVHRDPRWFPSPEAFDPDRFGQYTGDSALKSCYLPFGIGPHVCLGNSLTLMMLSLILTDVIRHYRLELAAGQPDVEPEVGIVIRPKGGLRLTVTRR